MSFVEEAEWEDAASVDATTHVGPWPAFVDLFAATTLILLVFFVVIAYRYVGEVGDVVKVKQLAEQLSEIQKQNRRFEVQQQGADVLLILEEQVTFQTSHAELLEPARQTLRMVDSLLKQSRFTGLVREVEILGHADRRGNAFANWQLSAQRAVAVAQFLVDSLGANPCSIVASGRGAFFPRDVGTRPDTLQLSDRLRAFARDRRVEILLHPSIANQHSAERRGCMAARHAP
jgi:outer membrane protein OmpA-like peptidoglycan-associated protein